MYTDLRLKLNIKLVTRIYHATGPLARRFVQSDSPNTLSNLLSNREFLLYFSNSVLQPNSPDTFQNLLSNRRLQSRVPIVFSNSMLQPNSPNTLPKSTLQSSSPIASSFVFPNTILRPTRQTHSQIYSPIVLSNREFCCICKQYSLIQLAKDIPNSTLRSSSSLVSSFRIAQ